MIIYSAAYCDCIYDSGYSSISLHKTREGAELAIENHKLQEESDYIKNIMELIESGYYDKDYLNENPYIRQEWENYKIYEYELLD